MDEDVVDLEGGEVTEADNSNEQHYSLKYGNMLMVPDFRFAEGLTNLSAAEILYDVCGVEKDI